jgi:predicted phage replisome organizer
MRERKYVKFRVDMYEDTKFKIIDLKPERDVIHYIWNRLVLLAGKVNLEGDMFLSKNIAYTIETLAIEFNRDASQIKLALEVFIELEMIELTEDKVYKVKNFAKHQNIKVKKKIAAKSEESEVKNAVINLNENLNNQAKDAKHDDFDGQVENIKTNVDKFMENESLIVGNNADGDKNINKETLEPKNKDIILMDEGKEDKDDGGKLLEYSSKKLESKKSMHGNRKRKKSKSRDDSIDEIVTYDEIEDEAEDGFVDEIKPLRKGETTIAKWSLDDL